MNPVAIKAIQDHDGIIILLPMSVTNLVELEKGLKKKVLDTHLAQATGLNCIVAISEEGSKAARAALGITVGK